MASKNNPFLIDANVWIAYFNDKDSLYIRAKKKIDRINSQNGELILTDFLLQEIVTVFLYQKKVSLIDNFLKYIEEKENVKTLSVDSDFLTHTLSCIKKHKYKPKMSLTDWSLLFLASNFDLKLITFDKQLRNKYKDATS